MLQTPGATSFMGSIGKDKYGEAMKKDATAAGVNVSLLYVYYKLLVFGSKLQEMDSESCSCFISRFTIMKMRQPLLELAVSVLWVEKGRSRVFIRLTSEISFC